MLDPEKKLLLSFFYLSKSFRVLPEVLFGYCVKRKGRIKDLIDDFNLILLQLDDTKKQCEHVIVNGNIPFDFYCLEFTPLLYTTDTNEMISVGKGNFIKTPMIDYAFNEINEFDKIQIFLEYAIINKQRYEIVPLKFVKPGVYTVERVPLYDALIHIRDRLIESFKNDIKVDDTKETPKHYVDFRLLRGDI